MGELVTTTLLDVLRGVLAQAGRNGDASAQLAGGLVVRATRIWEGWRITLERVRVEPAAHEVATMTTAASLLGWKVIKAGSEEAGMLNRKWIDLARW